jgi:hypothetical protein
MIQVLLAESNLKPLSTLLTRLRTWMRSAQQRPLLVRQPVQQVQGFLWAQSHLLPFFVDNQDGLIHEIERCHQRASLSTPLSIHAGCEQGTSLTG